MIAEGDLVLLIGKRKIIVRVSSGMSRVGSGTADLSRLIGMEYGESISLWGQDFRVYPASVRDMVLDFERGPQVVHPKDSAIIVSLCDLRPGKKVLEAGVGSGWMSALLANAVAPDGMLISYDISERSISIAGKNMERTGLPHEIRKGDIRSAEIPERFHAAVLDMPAPWEAMENVSKALIPGGHLCIYVPTYNQLERTVISMEKDFFGVSAREIIEREISVKSGATRPSFTGLMHTGFIIHGRKV